MLWKNGRSSVSHHTKPPSYKNGCAPKTFVHIILAAKWLVWHSSTSPTNSDDLCLLFCLYPFSMVLTYGSTGYIRSLSYKGQGSCEPRGGSWPIVPSMMGPLGGPHRVLQTRSSAPWQEHNNCRRLFLDFLAVVKSSQVKSIFKPALLIRRGIIYFFLDPDPGNK